MKKILIAVITVGVAIAAQAASVTWSATSVKDIAGNNAKSVTGWSAVCTIWSADGSTIIGSDTDTDSNSMSKFSGSISGTATSTTYLAQLVITDDKGNTITSEKAEFTTDSSAEYGEINFTNGSKFKTATAKIDYATGWTAAPEPTSGLLLLLGVAGLALKRKRA